jgi:hypothetical protein
MKRRVMALFDSALPLGKDDMMRSTEHEGGIKLPVWNLYITDLDVQTLHRAVGFLESMTSIGKPYDSNKLAFSVAYTTNEFPPDLNADKDIAAHHDLLSSDQLGLVNPSGTVLRCMDFAPGYACGMHRTQSLE